MAALKNFSVAKEMSKAIEADDVGDGRPRGVERLRLPIRSGEWYYGGSGAFGVGEPVGERVARARGGGERDVAALNGIGGRVDLGLWTLDVEWYPRKLSSVLCLLSSVLWTKAKEYNHMPKKCQKAPRVLNAGRRFGIIYAL